MIKPFTIIVPTEDKSVEIITEKKPGMFMPDFTKSMNVPIQAAAEETHTTEKKRRGRPRKNEPVDLFSNPNHMSGQIVSINMDTDDKGNRPLSIMETNEPFDNKYQETNNILRSAIVQLDSGMAEIQADIDQKLQDIKK